MPPARFARSTPLPPAWRVLIFSVLIIAIVAVGYLLGRQTFRLIWGDEQGVPASGQTKPGSTPPPMSGIINIELASPTPPTPPALSQQIPAVALPSPRPILPPAHQQPATPPPGVSPKPVAGTNNTPPKIPDSSPPPKSSPIGSKITIQNQQGLIVRRGPSSRLARIARLDPGTRVQVKAIRTVGKTEWVEVSFKNGKSGWIPSRELSP